MITFSFTGPKPLTLSMIIPESLIQKHFESKMKSDKIELLRDFEEYSKHLPVREHHENIIPLYKQKFYARVEDIEQMAKRIMAKPPVRKTVPYVAAPASSGKSSSILPAFLLSKSMTNGATHYFYMAFHNNNHRCFKVLPCTPNEDELIAKNQGAAFIVECVKRLLENKKDLVIHLNKKPPLWQDSVGLLNEFLQDKLGNKAKIWFHLDEHYQMCKRDGSCIETGAAFSRGAMTALASAKNVKVIATYTDRPLSISPMSSSQVCRWPVALPILDINEVMATIPDFNFLSKHRNNIKSRDLERLLASMKFRLAYKIAINPLGMLHIPESFEKVGLIFLTK